MSRLTNQMTVSVAGLRGPAGEVSADLTALEAAVTQKAEVAGAAAIASEQSREMAEAAAAIAPQGFGVGTPTDLNVDLTATVISRLTRPYGRFNLDVAGNAYQERNAPSTPVITDGNPIGTLSAGGFTFTAPTDADRPAITTSGSHKGITFDATSNYLTSTDFATAIAASGCFSLTFAAAFNGNTRALFGLRGAGSTEWITLSNTSSGILNVIGGAGSQYPAPSFGATGSAKKVYTLNVGEGELTLLVDGVETRLAHELRFAPIQAAIGARIDATNVNGTSFFQGLFQPYMFTADRLTRAQAKALHSDARAFFADSPALRRVYDLFPNGTQPLGKQVSNSVEKGRDWEQELAYLKAQIANLSRQLPRDVTYFGIVGQSNAVSRALKTGTIGAAIPGVLMWNAATQTVIQATSPLAHPDGAEMQPTMFGPEWQFAKRWLAANPGRQICFVPMARGGTSFGNAEDIRNWAPTGARALYMVAQMNAIAAQNPTWKLGGFLCSLGESNLAGTTTAAEFSAYMDGLVAQARTVADASEATPFVWSGLAPMTLYLYSLSGKDSAGYLAAIRGLPSRIPYTAYASWHYPTYLPTIKADTLHLDATGQVGQGDRWFDAWVAASANMGVKLLAPE